MTNYINNIKASYNYKERYLELRIEGKVVITTFILDGEDNHDYWHGFSHEGQEYDANLHDYTGECHLNIYEVIRGEMNGSEWQDVELSLI